jgi:hypothetical protein
MRSSITYDADPATINTPFAADEAVALLRAIPKDLLRNKECIQHLLSRLAATATALRQARIDFDNELRARSQILPASGGATLSVNPEQAARFLSPEQLSRLFDKFAQERLTALEVAKSSAEDSMIRSQSLLNSINKLLSDSNLDVETRRHLTNLLHDSRQR